MVGPKKIEGIAHRFLEIVDYGNNVVQQATEEFYDNTKPKKVRYWFYEGVRIFPKFKYPYTYASYREDGTIQSIRSCWGRLDMRTSKLDISELHGMGKEYDEEGHLIRIRLDQDNRLLGSVEINPKDLENRSPEAVSDYLSIVFNIEQTTVHFVGEQKGLTVYLDGYRLGQDSFWIELMPGWYHLKVVDDSTQKIILSDLVLIPIKKSYEYN